MLFALIALFTFTLWREPSTRQALITGAAIALAMSVRPFNLGLLMGLLLGLCATLAAYSRFTEALAAVAGTVGASVVLLMIPVLARASFAGVGVVSQLGFYPLSPLKMLFTDHMRFVCLDPGDSSGGDRRCQGAATSRI